MDSFEAAVVEVSTESRTIRRFTSEDCEEAENFIIYKATGELKTKTVHGLDAKAKLQLRVHRRCCNVC